MFDIIQDALTDMIALRTVKQNNLYKCMVNNKCSITEAQNILNEQRSDNNAR